MGKRTEVSAATVQSGIPKQNSREIFAANLFCSSTDPVAKEPLFLERFTPFQQG
jgi:hypothetical protein